MSTVTPIRPGVESSSAEGSGSADVEGHLAQARAIVDLVYICEVNRALDELDDRTLEWALVTATDHLEVLGFDGEKLIAVEEGLEWAIRIDPG